MGPVREFRGSGRVAGVGSAAARLGLALALAALLAAPAASAPQPAGAAETRGPETGLPMPRFVSARANKVNVRTGPGQRYPVEWVYLRRSMPFEVTAEFGHWRRVRDWQGAEGWVHGRMLSGRRTVVVTDKRRTLRREARAEARAEAFAEPGVIGELLECEVAWCRVDLRGHRGWLRRGEFWGAYPGEIIE